MEERRERDPDTGESVFVATGSGLGDIFSNVAAKLTGKRAKKLATKAAEKLVKKLVSLLEKKIYDKFSSKKKGTTETKGEEIAKLLREATREQAADPPKVVDQFKYVKDVYNSLL